MVDMGLLSTDSPFGSRTHGALGNVGIAPVRKYLVGLTEGTFRKKSIGNKILSRRGAREIQFLGLYVPHISSCICTNCIILNNLKCMCFTGFMV